METKKRRKKYVRRSPESYRKEVSEITNGEYSVLGDYVNNSKKIAHVHNKCGHIWELRPKNFIGNGNRCPKCNAPGVFRTAEIYRKEVSGITNGEYSVVGDFTKMKTKIPHLHNKCGYEWEVRPDSFIHGGSRCPNCVSIKAFSKSNDDFLKEAFDIAGDEYSFLEPYTSAHSKIGVRHNTCGKIYKTVPGEFLRGWARCPVCIRKYNQRKSDYQFKKEVFNLVGEEYSFLEPYVGAMHVIKVRHNSCGHSYKVSPNGFINLNNRCPNCVFSRGEKAVAVVLDSLSIEYTREHSFEYLGRKRFDFFIPSLNIAIEYDGEQHYKSIDAWGGEEYLESVRQSDALKNDFCEYMGIDLLRIPYWEFDNIDEIVTNFIDTVKLMRSISASGSEMSKCR